MLIPWIPVVAAIAVSPVVEPQFRVSARLQEAPITQGAVFEAVVTLEMPEGWIEGKGLPRPLLQIDAPRNVRPEGREVTEYRQLARNGFLNEPWERIISAGETRIAMRIAGPSHADDRLAFNVVAYVTEGPEGPSRFVRRRVELPLTPGAANESVSNATVSNWGRESGLQIGDEAETFELPRADGSILRLADVIGTKNIIVTTYRAFW
ncbi:MAG: hypothetical protein H6811_02930 [Phycisphaeraceae bacterium]|nr:hypothetical protein [Phycisphaeraceae bacterium]